MFKRLIKTIKWLLNNPPIGIIDGAPEGTVCDYCGTSNYLWNDIDGCTICHRCKKKAFDKVLGKPKKKEGGENVKPRT